MDSLKSILAQQDERVSADAKRYKELPADECQMCLAQGPDKRSLFIRCLYAVHEQVPEAIQLREADVAEQLKDFYYLLICKRCRGDLLQHLAEWREQCIARRDMAKDHDGNPYSDEEDPERCIPVRKNGTIVYMTEEEWHADRARKEK